MARKRFPIRIFAVLLLLVLAIGFGLNWHFKSMAQFNALLNISDQTPAAGRFSTDSPGGAISDSTTVFLQDEVEFDVHSGFWLIKKQSPEGPRGGNLKWLCGLLDYRYLLQVPLVLVNEPNLVSENQVAKLKGIKQIVILGYVDEDVVRRWKLRFPKAKVFTSEQTSEYPYDDYAL